MNTSVFPFQSLADSDAGERRVLFLLLPNVNLLDLAGPAQVFHTAAELEGGMSYTLLFCAHQSELSSAQGLTFHQLHPLPPVSSTDLVIIPGLNLRRYTPSDIPVGFEPDLYQWLNDAHHAGAHIASVCTGAFVLGEAGLLDGRRCTTHWEAVAILQARYPQALVQDAALFVHDQKVTTSAGIASGIDMALSLLEQDHGPLLAAQVARHLVVYLRRNGFQPQHSVFLEYRTHAHPGVHLAQDYLIAHITESVSIHELAAVAQLSTRSLTRVFRQATGLTPIGYHQRLRLELASMFLDNSNLSIEVIAGKCGFDDTRHFRRLWSRQFGSPPSARRLQGKD